jgi:hypothetical protein
LGGGETATTTYECKISGDGAREKHVPLVFGVYRYLIFGENGA